MNKFNKFDEATEALYSGDADTASRLLAEGVALALDPRIVAQQVRHQLALEAENERAVQKLFKEYPEIAQDRNMALVANDLCVRLESQGLSRPEAIAAVGEEMERKLRLGKWKPEAEPIRNQNQIRPQSSRKCGGRDRRRFEHAINVRWRDAPRTSCSARKLRGETAGAGNAS